MIYTISNSELTVSISTLGAEVQSITNAHTGHEYLWNGDAQWWNGHSPILFPIVGGLWNGTCRIDGQEISLPKHGIVRRAEWKMVKAEAERISFEFCSTVGTFQTFPFAFCLAVTYELQGNRLNTHFEVSNWGGCALWFQVGGHPAFNLPHFKEENNVDGYLRLEGNARYVLRAGEQGCLEPEQHPVPFGEDGLVPLSVETFSHEALIFEENQVKAATVLDVNKQPVARIESTAPVWLFWSPKGKHTPFVCAEPWYGLCDRQGFTGDVSQRPFINCAEPGTTWTGGYSIELF